MKIPDICISSIQIFIQPNDGLIMFPTVCLSTLYRHGNYLVLLSHLNEVPDIFAESYIRNIKFDFHEEICILLVRRNWNIITSLPEKNRTYKVCQTAVCRNPHALRSVPEKYRDYMMCLDCVSKNPELIKYVPLQYRDRKLVLTALRKDGCVLKLMNKKYRTEEYCRVAFEQTTRAFAYIPGKYKTREMTILAVRQHKDMIIHVKKGNLIKYITEIYNDRSITSGNN